MKNLMSIAAVLTVVAGLPLAAMAADAPACGRLQSFSAATNDKSPLAQSPKGDPKARPQKAAEETVADQGQIADAGKAAPGGDAKPAGK
jgi:hypothetical protein